MIVDREMKMHEINSGNFTTTLQVKDITYVANQNHLNFEPDFNTDFLPQTMQKHETITEFMPKGFFTSMAQFSPHSFQRLQTLRFMQRSRLKRLNRSFIDLPRMIYSLYFNETMHFIVKLDSFASGTSTKQRYLALEQ